MNHRRTAAVVLAAALMVPLFVGATRLAGWGSGDAAAPAGGKADAQALREFAAGLSDARELTYTATYATGGGTPITASQAPPQRAYRSVTAVYLAGPDSTVLCRTPTDEPAGCTRSAGTDGIPLTHARGLTDVLAADFIAPELVSAYISRLAARVPGRVIRSDRTVAGLATRCVEVKAVVAACATAEGVLAHFESPDGRLTLTAYQPTVPPDAFTLPAGATTTDLDG